VICNVPRARLFQYLDGEVPESELAAIEDHLLSCVDCSHFVRSEEAFRATYAHRLRPDPVPEDVRERIDRLLAALPEPPRRLGRWRARLGVLAAMAALVAVGGGLIVAGGGLGLALRAGWHGPGVSITELADASVDQHQKLARGLLPFDIAPASPREAEAWFRGRLDFNVSIPDLKDQNLSFLGGRISHLREVEVAALGYRVDGTSVSLFVIPEEKYQRLGLRETPKFKIVHRRGYDVIVWRSHGAGYSLVSEIGGKSCLVCHGADERLDLTPSASAHRS
jgi:anti-sigma factor RsiW